MDELSDRIRKGDREAFDRLCRERYASLISYARIFLDVTSAEDVVQDVLFALLLFSRCRSVKPFSLQNFSNFAAVDHQ